MTDYIRKPPDEYPDYYERCSVCRQLVRIGRHPEGGEYEPPLPITSARFNVRANCAICLAGTSTALSGGETSPSFSPVEVNLDLTAGKKVVFTSYGAFGTASDLDGDTSNIVTSSAQNSIGGLTAPNYSLIGVFLTDAASDSAPSTLDFTLEATRNYTSLSPAIAQPFFIGEGEYVSSDETYYRQVVIPSTATRLFLANHVTSNWALLHSVIRGSAFMASSFSHVSEFLCGPEGHGIYVLTDRAASQGCPFCGSPAWRSGGKAGDLKRVF